MVGLSSEESTLQRLFFAEIQELREWKLDEDPDLAPIAETMRAMEAHSFLERNPALESLAVYKEGGSVDTAAVHKKEALLANKLREIRGFLRTLDDAELYAKLCRWASLQGALLNYDTYLEIKDYERLDGCLSEWRMNWESAKKIPTAFHIVESVLSQSSPLLMHAKPALYNEARETLIINISEELAGADTNLIRSRVDQQTRWKEMKSTLQDTLGLPHDFVRDAMGFFKTQIAAESQKTEAGRGV